MNERPWLAHYPAGMPAEIDPERYSSLEEVFQETFASFSQKPAFENMGKVLTFCELDGLSRNFAAYLQRFTNLKPGDRIAIQMPNCLQYPVAFIGALRAGLIVVNTNPLYTPREMKHQFIDSGATAIVIIANAAHNLEKIIERTDIKTVIITELGDLLGGVKKHIVNFVVRRLKKLVPPYTIPHAIRLQHVLNKGRTVSLSPVKNEPNETVLLQYTGGTTGISRGAELSHRNMTANLQQSESFVRTVYPTEATAIIPLPLYHVIALHGALSFMKLGYKSVLITNPKDIPGYIKVLKSQPFHIMIGVNTLFNALANHPKIRTVDFSNLKGSIGGGMAIQEAVSEKWKALVGHHITQGYGLSEASPMLAINIPGKDKPGYIGIPFPSTEIRIVDDNGNDVKPGEPGELCARGPQIFKGYWNKDNQEVFYPDGWFKTGDIGLMEPDGYFKLVDRKKDMILVSGFNVYPNEIEAVVASHPKVHEVAAIGVKDDHSTEAVKLFVIKREASLTEHELREFCKKHLVNYKRPKHIEFRSDLPKSHVGKILRRALREPYDT